MFSFPSPAPTLVGPGSVLEVTAFLLLLRPRPSCMPLFWLSKHSSLWGQENLIWVIIQSIPTEGVSLLQQLSSMPCSQPLPAEKIPPVSGLPLTAKADTQQSLFWRQIWMKVPRTPFTYSCSWHQSKREDNRWCPTDTQRNKIISSRRTYFTITKFLSSSSTAQTPWSAFKTKEDQHKP